MLRGFLSLISADKTAAYQPIYAGVYGSAGGTSKRNSFLNVFAVSRVCPSTQLKWLV